ncbi:MAG: signal peptidase I [Candidatus Obscuribacterales bacterium]|nr:signal peptidase I [Candidatus Obscuribacterales bacterium]
MKSVLAIIGTTLLYPIFLLLLLITIRLFIEARFIPSQTMTPALEIDDRVLVEKVTTFLRRPYNRGEIIVFYPPPVEMSGKDLSWDGMHVLGRLTGFSFLPSEPAFIKRVIGLPGDTIRIVSGQGVFLNGKKLDETSYIQEQPHYSLTTLQDIGGRRIDGSTIQPYGSSSDAQKSIVVPPGQLFVLGDNRNNSQDSHVFGMVSEDHVIGCAMMKFWPVLKVIEPPTYRVE